MRGDTLRLWVLFCLFFVLGKVSAQSTSWTGTVSDAWRNSLNWTNGVPDASKDAIIGDASFVGPNQPELNIGFGVGQCKSLTLGNGIIPSTLTESDGLFIYGDVLIGANGVLDNNRGHLRVEGNWTNNGTYTAGTSNRRVYFIGTNQTIGGTSVTDFEKLYINSGSTVTLAQHVTISNFLELNGTLDPTPNFKVTAGTNDINIRSGGVLKVKASTLTGNYSANSVQTLSNNAVIDYASTTVNQTVSSAISYEILQISGAMTKSLSANISVDRDLIIDGGTLDLQTFTANRNSNGGDLTLAALATLRIGGSNGFPSNYSSILIAPTSLVEYYGVNQTVMALDYGNLTLSSAGGAITKTMPATAIKVAGNFTMSASAGTLSTTAGNALTIGGNVNLGAATSFNGSSFAHSFGGNWTNNGAYSVGPGCTGTLTSVGAGSVWSGTGTNNFGSLLISGNGTTLNAGTSVSLCGNFSVTGGGSFTHLTGGAGTFTMTGAAKTISGSNIIFDDLIIASGSVSTTSTMIIGGDLTATGTLTATAGTISLVGSAKTISGIGALQFFALNVPGTISTGRSLLIASNFSVAGSFTASAGQTTFNGTSTFSGTADLFNIRITSTSSLVMGGSATLRIAGTETLDAGYTFNATSNTPNTVNYNGSGAQSVGLISFHHLILSGGNTKTPAAGFTANGNVTINAGTTFAGGGFTYNVGGNWVNNGTFTPGSSTVQFMGANDATITGTTTFSSLVVNKSASNKVTLINSISATNATMTSGLMLTGANSITITATRTGAGIILGTITRTHTFNTGIQYAFEGPDNFINFSTVGTVSSITVKVENKIISGFPSGAPINRLYTISAIGTGYSATLRLHYEQVEVNGNAEGAMTMWTDQGIGVWANVLKDTNDPGNNWVEQTGLTTIVNSWTLSDGQNVIAWTGLAVGAFWSLPGNWTSVSGSPGTTPTVNDIVLLGDRSIIGWQPVITTAAQAKGIIFKSDAAVTLTLGSGGSLTVQGNIEGDWSADRTHTIDVGSQTLTTFSDLELSEGVANQNIDLLVSTGTITVNGSLTQAGGADVTFTGTGTLNVGKEYRYTSGTFTAGAGNVTYNGVDDQTVAPLTYNNLKFDKVLGVASTTSMVTVNGDLTLGTSGGQLELGGALNVSGDVTIASGAILNSQSQTLNVGGNWVQTGSFIPGTGILNFNGTGAQSISATTVNTVEVDKAGGTLTLLGAVNVNNNVSILNGIVDVGTFNVTRTTTGGTATLGAGTTARFAGSGLQIANFASLVASPTSTVEYYGTSVRPIPPIAFGNLTISNGGANAKSMVGPTTVQGNLTVNAGATLTAPASTLTVLGSIVSNGTFDTSNSTLILNGASKTISGTITYNNLVVNGSYDLISGNATFNGHLQVNGDFDLGGATVVANSDLTNSGILSSSGVVTFTGTQVQTIRLLNAVSSSSTGVVNFNGTVSPIFDSNSSPVFATVNINNTSPITASQPWTVGVAMNISASSTWNAGPFKHSLFGNFNNAGITNSSGTILFSPSTTANVTLGTNFNTTGKVVFSGVGKINLSDINQVFGSVEVLNTNAAGINPSTGWTLTDNLLIGAGAILHGGSGLTHTIGGGWTNNGTYEGGSSIVKLTSTSGLDEITGAGGNNFYTILFDAGSNLTVAAPIFVAGDFTNDGASLSFESASVTFNGGTSSLLGGAVATTFEELDISKTGSFVQMNRDATVTDILSLTSGELRLNSNTLLITNPLVSSLTTAGGYIISENTSNNSRVNWVINNDFDAHIIPFGTTGGDLIPFTFVLTSGDGGILSVATYGTGNDNLPLPPTVTELNDQFGANNSLNTVDRFYQIDLIGATSPTANITFVASMAEVGTISNLTAQRWNGGWEAPILGQISGLNTVTVSGVTQFSPWAISGNSSPLPVTLVSFNAQQVKNQVALEWVTASEINNDYFEVQKSWDGKEFFSIGEVKGNGNSTSTRKYTYADGEIKEGILYYRLKQVDYDKKFYYSKVVAVSIGENHRNITFSVFPNPVVEELSITTPGYAGELVRITMYDPSGKVVMENTSIANLDNTPVRLNVTGLKPGMYVIKIIAGNQSKAYRITRMD